MGFFLVFDEGCPLVNIAFHVSRIPAVAGLRSLFDLCDLDSVWLLKSKRLELERVGDLVSDFNTVAHLFI